MYLMHQKIHLSYNFGRGLPYEIEGDIQVSLSDDTSVVIPKGFMTDGSSTPWWLKWMFPPIGRQILASIVHDYLYNIDKSRGKKFADKEMLIISKEYNNRNVFKLIDNYLRYAAVVVGGKNSWNN
tara:strand:+ start:41 stop:415 length:375 start_codon:yes stop_codon:yes gene_type:complete